MKRPARVSHGLHPGEGQGALRIPQPGYRSVQGQDRRRVARLHGSVSTDRQVHSTQATRLQQGAQHAELRGPLQRAGSLQEQDYAGRAPQMHGRAIAWHWQELGAYSPPVCAAASTLFPSLPILARAVPILNAAGLISVKLRP